MSLEMIKSIFLERLIILDDLWKILDFIVKCEVWGDG